MTSRAIVIETVHVAPSVNALFGTNWSTKKRFATKPYEDWQKAAGWDFNGKGHIAGEYRLVVTIDKRAVGVRSDLSNRIKAIEDLLVKHGIVDDDHLCVHLAALWQPLPNRGMRIEVIPETGVAV